MCIQYTLCMESNLLSEEEDTGLNLRRLLQTGSPTILRTSAQCQAREMLRAGVGVTDQEVGTPDQGVRQTPSTLCICTCTCKRYSHIYSLRLSLPGSPLEHQLQTQPHKAHQAVVKGSSGILVRFTRCTLA